MRPHLSLVVTGTPNSQASISLNLLGATARFIVDEKIIDTLCHSSGTSRLIADAIIVDGTFHGRLEQFPILRFVKIAKSIKAISDSVAMPNGVRWNMLPVVLIVKDYETEAQIASDYTLRSILSVWSVSRGFPYIYDAISRSVETFAMELIDQMRNVGWKFENEHGRIRRVAFQMPHRRRGFLPELDTKFYTFSSDHFLVARKYRRFALSVMTSSGEYITRTLEQYESYLDKPGTKEGKFQELLAKNPYLIGATYLETFPHPFLIRENGECRIPDIVVHPFSDEDNSMDAHVIELKTPGMGLLRGKGHRQYISGKISPHISQLQEYGRIINDDTYLDQICRIFGSKIYARRFSLIGGLSRTLDHDILTRECSQFRKGHGVDIVPYDEHFARELRRYDA